MSKKLDSRAKDFLCQECRDPYTELASTITKQAEGKLARKVFKDVWAPQFEEFEQTFPDIYKMLLKGKYLMAGRATYELSKAYPVTADLISRQSWDTTRLAKINSEAMKQVAGPDLQVKFAKAAELEKKATEVYDELQKFLEPFEHAAQIPFSFPQLLPFIENRLTSSRWGSGKLKPQKRPRVVRVPSARLRELVTAAWLLKVADKERS